MLNEKGAYGDGDKVENKEKPHLMAGTTHTMATVVLLIFNWENKIGK